MLTLGNLESLLEVGANVAEIVTGVVAAIVGGRYLWFVRQRRMVLETLRPIWRANGARMRHRRVRGRCSLCSASDGFCLDDRT